ncbi:MAG: hypothetical protein U9P10_11215 [Thermodesulfobacteriota bacterium]|nr:hypothetical protein [Thermodesulfobacteriota bacterium]
MGLTTFFAMGVGVLSVLICVDRFFSTVRPSERSYVSQGKRIDWYCFFSPDTLTGEKRRKQDQKRIRDRKVYRQPLEEQRPMLRA